MARITVAGGPSNWREAFLSHPGLAVTPENYALLTAPAEPEPAPEPAAAVQPDRPAPRTPPRRPPVPAGGDG